MSDNSQLSFENNAPSLGNPVHTHGPFPIMSFGGENLGNNFTNAPSMFPISTTAAPTSGTWLANLKLAVLSHKHSDGTPCFNVLEHAAQADSEEDPSFLQAHAKLIQHILAPERERCANLEDEKRTLVARNSTLLDDNHRLQQLYDESQARRDHRTPAGSTKRKSDPLDSPDRRPPPPSGSGRPERPNSAVPPSYTRLGSEPYPNRSTATILYQHANYRPGFEPTGLLATWTDKGWLDVPRYILEHTRLRTLPSVIAFSGSPCGSQTLPDDASELTQLTTRANTPGNFRSLFRLRDSMGIAQIIDGLGRELRTSTVPIPAISKQLLRSNPRPDWSDHTRFLDIKDVSLDLDTIANWDSSPCRIPSIRTPNGRASDEDYALFMYVHYDNLGHLGVIVTDSGLVQLDSVMSHRILSVMTPAKRTGIYEFRREFVRLVSWPGLYKNILESKGILVNSDGHITKCPTELSRDVEGLARHFASCNVTPATVASMFHWGLQYCLDVQDIPSVPEPRRHEFAQIYKYARIRSLFFPITRPREDRTYSIPSHIHPFEILEYRRRQFVINHWKETDTLPTPDYKVPVHHYSKSPPASVPVSVDQLSISDDGNASSPPSGPTAVSTAPNESASATSVGDTASEIEPEQSANATAVPNPEGTPPTGNDVDMAPADQNAPTTQDKMEDVE
ncbi:hypothetical protein PM082_020181 [Marasmius tenuissimus]|nr:hypothetical protein PM082_020181 [Marasmius tenuissimus]